MKLNNPFYFSPITKQLATLILGMGFILTILISIIQSFYEYDRLKLETNAQLLLIEKTHLSSIVEGLWIEDQQRIQLLIEGLVNFENIAGVAIYKNSNPLYSSGNVEIESDELNNKTYELKKYYRNKKVALGKLVIFTDSHFIGQKIKLFFINKLFFSSFFIAIMVIFFMFAYRRSVGQPLSELTYFIKHIDLDNMHQIVSKLSHITADENNNEFLKVKHVIGLMAQRLVDSYKEIEDQKSILDLHSIVAITDTKGTITYANNLFSKISGYSNQELIGQNHRLLSSKIHDNTFWQKMYQTIANGNVWHGEVCNFNKRGERYWVDTTICAILDDNNKPIKYISLLTDISARKQNEEELINAKEKAEAATHAKSEFLANMSHEIRTPMNGVIGMTNLLLDSKLGDDQHGKALTIRRSAESLLTVVNDILDYSKIEAGQLDLEIIEFDLRQLVGEFATTMAFRAEEKGLEFICPATLLEHHWYLGDPARIRQVLNNLVGNAIKFTTQGEISVHIDMEELSNNKHQLTFLVKDTGIGIQLEDLDYLFKRFTQADGSTTRKYGGTGLGLAICKQLIDLMGGEIGASSEIDHGSNFKFCIELPVVTMPKAFETKTDLNQSYILVVDDNETNRNLLSELFKFWHIKYQVVESGALALEAMHKAVSDNHPFNLAILDMCMPQMDGAELGTLIHNDPALHQTRTMLLTSQGRRGDAQRMFEAGFSAYLSKPVDQSELYNALLQLSGINGEQDRLITRYTANERKQFNAKILLVEDNSTNQAVAKGVLDQFGLSTDIANNGQKALEMLLTNTYDLVFMDCQMPVMDGYDATRFIRTDKTQTKNKNISIIAMTANAMKGDREKSLDVGMNDHITKPISAKMILKALDAWLPKNLEVNTKTHETQILKELIVPISNIDTEFEIFDYDALSRRMLNNQTTVNIVINAFLDDANSLIHDVINILDSNDKKQIINLLHRIKGTTANIGGLSLSELAKRLELLAKEGNIKAVQNAKAEIEQSFNKLIEAMKQKLS